jgi:hypothetical protein
MNFRKPIFALLACLLVFPAGACNLGDIVTKGSTSRSVALDIIDSTDGTPETGVVFNTSGIDLWYRREGAVRTAITEATLAALTTAWSSGGFLHVSDGAYRLDVPDAAFATSANYVDIGGTVTGMVVICQRVRLVDYSLEDSVRMGLMALPNAAAAASGGLLISGSNSGTTTLGALTITGATTHTGATIHTGNVSMAAGLNVTQSTSNTPALVVTGNGTGSGATITGGSGATGTGLVVASGATNGAGLTVTGTGTGAGATLTSGSGATGNGLNLVAASTNGNGLAATGTGTGAGQIATAGATGVGLSLIGGGTSGNALGTTVTAPIGQVKGFGILESGTLQSATATTAVLRSATSYPDNTLIGSTIVITGGTGVGQRCTPTAWTSSSDTATCATWTTTPDNTSTYEVWGTAAGTGAAPTVAQIATGVWQDATAGDFTTASSIGKSLYTGNVVPGGTGGLFIAGTNAATTITTSLTTAFTGNLTGSVGSVTGAVGSVTGAVGSVTGAVGSVTGSVGSVASGGIADASFATTAGPFRALGIVDQGTAQAATGTTLQLRSAAAFANSELVGNTVLITGGTTGVGQSRIITAYVGATDTATVATWDTTPTGTITYTINSTTAAAAGGGLDAAATRAALGFSSASYATDIAALQSDTDNIQTRLPAALVSGRMDASVGAMAANTVTAAAAASDLTTELQTGLATSAAQTTAQTSLDDIPTNAELATSQAAADDATLAAVALVPAAVWNVVIEDQGGGITAGCAEAVKLALLGGDFTSVGSTTTFEDPSGTETRAVATYATGTRTITVTCPTP